MTERARPGSKHQGLQIGSVAQSCPTLCDPMNCSTPGLSVHHQLPGLAQTHVHGVGDVIQLSHPLSFPSPPAFNLSQHQGLFNESVLCIRWPKDWSFSFNISPSSEHLGLISFRVGLVGSSCSPRDSLESSPTPQFKSINCWHQVANALEFQLKHQSFQ